MLAWPLHGILQAVRYPERTKLLTDCLNPSDGNLSPYGSMKDDPVLELGPLALQEFAASYLTLALSGISPYAMIVCDSG